MTLSITTIIVVTANGLTAVLAAALLMLVLWQAPRQRTNQLFALVMLTLGAYSVINALSRFVGEINMDPAPVFYLATMTYGAFVVAVFYFGSAYGSGHAPTVRAMRLIGGVLVVVQGVLLWSGQLMINIRPVAVQDGGYQGEFTPLGYFATGTVLAYLIATTIFLYRMPDERGRSLWPAPFLMICSAVSATLIWPRVPLPFSAVFLAAAAAWMGWRVLRYELFNPLAELHVQLAQKNAELEAASEMKTQFLTSMSHELRTPLNSIIGYSELVISGIYGALNDTQRDRLQKVIRNGHHLLSLINDVLDLSRIEAGRVVLDRRAVPIPALLENVLATIEPLAQRKGLTITREFAGAPAVHADEMRARQIVTNVVANAVKFTHEGSVTVRAFGSGSMVQIEVIDTGIGITSEQADLVFAEFHQADSSVTRRYEGTGLGLAITKKLVELHGGRIWLESAPGHGTTFFITLPAVSASAEKDDRTRSAA
ncbi:MAG: HAMP domain-containing histidine kinase [Chloroflexi bacterium]|nr:HAMP domain-containing histidine kinase [Chloroflexota bacterium]